MHGKIVRNRKKRRMPCGIQVGSRTHSGLVLDLSPTGLFIQTNAKTTPGQSIEILLSTGSGDPIPLQVEVVRKKVVPPRLLTVTGGGVGVRILDATERYFTFLTEIGIAGGPEPDPFDDAANDAADAPEASEAGEVVRFRVRIKQTSGPRSRSIDVSAPDAASAAAHALEEVGDDWKVLDVAAL
jgi:hypothetical protein